MARKQAPKVGHVAIEPSQMTLPAMDRVSVQMAWFLDSMYIEAPPLGDDNDTTVYLTCNLCADRLCKVEDGDTLRVLLNTALAHTC